MEEEPRKAGPLLGEQTYTIETPEHVEIVYTVAGPGSRLLAFLLDSLVMLVPSLVLVAFLFVLVSILSAESVRELATGGASQEAFLVYMVLALLAMAQFLVSQFYFVVFELLWNGQSPGKRWQSIRVISQSGQPVGFFSSMIRNLIRIVDLLPLFYLAGFISMLATRNWMRLGDLAAGCVVVKVDDEGLGGAEASRRRALEGETGAPWPPGPVGGDPRLEEIFEREGLGRLDPAFFDVAERYLERRHRLQQEAAAALAEKIARPVMERMAVVGTDPEAFIEQAIAFRKARAGITSGGRGAP